MSLQQGISTDVERFESLAAGARPDNAPSMEEALAAYGGDLLPGDPYEEWTEAPRERLRLTSRRLRLDLAKLYHAEQRHTDAARVLEPLVLSDPCDEEANARIIRAYAATGDRSLALRQYERSCHALRQELGVEPSVELGALVEDIRRADDDRARGLTTVDLLDREGDQAAAFGAWTDAIAKYSDALDRLGTSEEELRYECAIRLKVADTLRTAGRSPEAAEQYRRVVDIATAISAPALRARAIYCFQEETDADRANSAGQREALELVESALVSVPPDDLSARALLLAAGSRPMLAANKAPGEEITTGRLAMAGPSDPGVEERLQEAVALARQGGDPWVLVACIERLRTFLAGPRTIETRLRLTSEMLAISALAPSIRIESSARLARHEDLMEFGDIDGARIQARQIARLAHRTSSPLLHRLAAWMLAAHASADGELDEAKRLIFEARDSVADPDQHSNVALVFGVQMLILRWHQGRVAEMEVGFRRMVDSAPSVAAIRAGLAFIYAETGREEEARTHYDVLTERGVDKTPYDLVWWFVTSFIARVAIRLGDKSVASALYAQMLPYAHLNASLANSVSLGSASLVLAQLARSSTYTKLSSTLNTRWRSIVEPVRRFGRREPG